MTNKGELLLKVDFTCYLCGKEQALSNTHEKFVLETIQKRRKEKL